MNTPLIDNICPPRPQPDPETLAEGIDMDNLQIFRPVPVSLN